MTSYAYDDENNLSSITDANTHATNFVYDNLAYVERNPVRAGIVRSAAEYQWSSAAAHLMCVDHTGLLDMEWWGKQGPKNWNEVLGMEQPEIVQQLRQCTYAGRHSERKHS